ncbi:hypothetical protein BDR03DRAFT_948939 [Suillus americanus]|nr:hypothetical protein BDR03DRAFT_948939 [Suillus americanus]
MTCLHSQNSIISPLHRECARGAARLAPASTLALQKNYISSYLLTVCCETGSYAIKMPSRGRLLDQKKRLYSHIRCGFEMTLIPANTSYSFTWRQIASLEIVSTNKHIVPSPWS